jgi:DNA-directed RNA polymerase subunit RPC12/RpoP
MSYLKCDEVCEAVISEALQRTAAEIDAYSNLSPPGLDESGNCGQCGSEQIEYSHHYIYKLNYDNKRSITTVYRCLECHHEIFEEDHPFECMYAANCTANCNFIQA